MRMEWEACLPEACIWKTQGKSGLDVNGFKGSDREQNQPGQLIHTYKMCSLLKYIEVDRPYMHIQDCIHFICYCLKPR